MTVCVTVLVADVPLKMRVSSYSERALSRARGPTALVDHSTKSPSESACPSTDNVSKKFQLLV